MLDITTLFVIGVGGTSLILIFVDRVFLSGKRARMEAGLKDRPQL